MNYYTKGPLNLWVFAIQEEARRADRRRRLGRVLIIAGVLAMAAGALLAIY